MLYTLSNKTRHNNKALYDVFSIFDRCKEYFVLPLCTFDADVVTPPSYPTSNDPLVLPENVFYFLSFIISHTENKQFSNPIYFSKLSIKTE